MSRRFGRNRRRRMREEIQYLHERTAELREAVNLQENLAAYSFHQKKEAEDQLRRIAEIVGDRFFGLDPAYTRVNAKFYNNTFMMAVAQGLSYAPSSPCYPIDTEATFQPLELVLLELRDETDYFTNRIHVRLGNDHEVRYAISKRALDDAPKDVLVSILSRQLALALANSLDKPKEDRFKEIDDFRKQLRSSQEPLGEEFDRILQENLNDLYEE